MFMVPDFDRRLPAHATNKSSELRQSGLQFLSSDFNIQIITDQDFPSERARLAEEALIILNPESEPANEQIIENWSSNNGQLIQNLDKKLDKMPTLATPKKEAVKTQLLGHYLSGEEHLSKLRDDYPATWEKIDKVIRARSRFLLSSNAFIREEPDRRLTRVVEELEDNLRGGAKELSQESAELIAWGTATGWMLECPLDFD
jgi:hypothetical protein